jgi:hypothetical protein
MADRQWPARFARLRRAILTNRPNREKLKGDAHSAPPSFFPLNIDAFCTQTPDARKFTKPNDGFRDPSTWSASRKLRDFFSFVVNHFSEQGSAFLKG